MKISKEVIKTRPRKREREPFPEPTDQEKVILAELREKLLGDKFDMYLMLARFRKLNGYYPPTELTIKIAQACLKAGVAHKWAYFGQAYKAEMPGENAKLEIAEHQRYKNEPVRLGEILRQAQEHR